MAPKVSIGLPVFNGERYLAEAIDSILCQDYEDFELLIQDNVSTDRTAAICRAYAEKDPRVSYECNRSNVGAAENHNTVFRRARGEYFMWAAHDDICAPNKLSQSVDVLDRDSSVVLVGFETALINDDGSPVCYDAVEGAYVDRHNNLVGRRDPANRAEKSSPAGRYWDVLVRTMRSFEIYGLIRADCLRKTLLHENYYGSDKVLLAELALNGRFRQVPEVFLYRRCHGHQSSRLNANQKGVWIGRRAERAMTVRFKKLIPAYFRVVARSPISTGQKLLCYGTILYRFIAPVTWQKEFRPNHYTDAVTA